MKKVLTITCNNVYNHGATLQQFALVEYIETLGFEAASIDYRPAYLNKKFSLLRTDSTKYNSNYVLKIAYIIAKLPSRLSLLRRKKSFDTFESTYIKIKDHVYYSNDELKINLPQADYYIAGSDQIWNSFFENGKDPAFYLDFVPDERIKISYAASFAIDEIEKNLKPFVKKLVSRLDYISVRETSALTILQNLEIDNAVQVLDPVFLLPSAFWKEKFVTSIKEKFIFVYDFDGNKYIERLVKMIAGERNLKIYTVNQGIKYAHKNFHEDNPAKFLSLIENAEFIVSNSFHAVAFSIIFKKEFLVVNRAEKINTRMRDLVDLFGLEKLLLIDENLVTFNYSDYKSIDYNQIQKRLEEEIEKSQKFLQKTLHEI